MDLSTPLLAWYRAEGRELPWRSHPHPYWILLSELLCQQTRLETALPYFERFVQRWPSLEALAAAELDEVLEMWAGLGYYRRARALHACAKAAVEAGGLPSRAAELIKLPGIGPYTAGAIASIAFGEATPAIDGNVERVLTRVHRVDLDPKKAPGRRALREKAMALHLEQAGHPGDLNQALMELGARVCTPRSPRCSVCPISPGCGGRASPERWPKKAARKRPVAVRGVAGLLHRGQAVWLGKRPENGLLAGLWEPVGMWMASAMTPEQALVEAFNVRARVQIQVGAWRGDVTHVFTHRRLTLSVYEVSAVEPPTLGGYYTDLRLYSGSGLALSTLARKALAVPAASQLPLAASPPLSS